MNVTFYPFLHPLKWRDICVGIAKSERKKLKADPRLAEDVRGLMQVPRCRCSTSDTTSYKVAPAVLMVMLLYWSIEVTPDTRSNVKMFHFL